MGSPSTLPTVIALHGFLGRPTDWNNEAIAYPIASAKSLLHWAHDFNEWVAATTHGPRTLMGYSMGGRLALHALLLEPTLWDRLVLLSTHPGLKEAKEREERLLADGKWAQRFRNDPWDDLMEDWEKQPVFKGSIRPIRLERDFDREELARQLENFSLGHQENLLPKLKDIILPVQWITGSKDTKFELLAKEACSINPLFSHLSVEGASHRILDYYV